MIARLLQEGVIVDAREGLLHLCPDTVQIGPAEGSHPNDSQSMTSMPTVSGSLAEPITLAKVQDDLTQLRIVSPAVGTLSLKFSSLDVGFASYKLASYMFA